MKTSRTPRGKKLGRRRSNRPIALDPSWLSPTVKALAQRIYDERTFDRLPLLADALEEAGCSYQDFLSHCQRPGPHVRGCWAVDLVLGQR